MLATADNTLRNYLLHIRLLIRLKMTKLRNKRHIKDLEKRAEKLNDKIEIEQGRAELAEEAREARFGLGGYAFGRGLRVWNRDGDGRSTCS
jgi:hypothetical protein